MTNTMDGINTVSVPALENQIFRLDDDGTGKRRYFFIGGMENYARKHLPIIPLRADPERASRMLASGALNAEYIMKLTGKAELAPILFCVGAGKNRGDLIVDGNHRYVAWTLALHERGWEMKVPAFQFEPEHWSQFVVPEELVSKMGLFDPPQRQG